MEESEGGWGLVGPDKDWMDQYRGFLFWKGPQGSSMSFFAWPEALGSSQPGPSLAMAGQAVWQRPFLPEQHPQIQAWFLLRVLTGATDLSLQRQTPPGSRNGSKVGGGEGEDMHAFWSWKEP